MTSTRIDMTFNRLRREGRKGFIAYITAGDPSLEATKEIVLRLEESGVDLVELGIPFSDPLADGRVNQESAARALAGGTTLDRVIDCVAGIRAKSQMPLMCYTYLNPLCAPGFEKSAADLATAGLDGLLILDLPFEEARNESAVLRRAGLNQIVLVTPTSADDRISRIVRRASGFVYCVSREGVTGAQQNLSEGAAAVVARTRAHTKLPVALGFGISTPEVARQAAMAADAIVVGSAVVDRFHRAEQTAAGRREAAAWVGTLVQAVKEIA